MAAYGMSTTVAGTQESVREKVVAALAAEGFGVLTRIDMTTTLRERIGAEIEPYEVLGACNPVLASKALEADRSVGLLLPCNVVIREVGDGVEVSILDPEAMFGLADPDLRERLEGLVADAKARLERALEAVARG